MNSFRSSSVAESSHWPFIALFQVRDSTCVQELAAVHSIDPHNLIAGPVCCVIKDLVAGAFFDEYRPWEVGRTVDVAGGVDEHRLSGRARGVLICQPKLLFRMAHGQNGDMHSSSLRPFRNSMFPHVRCAATYFTKSAIRTAYPPTRRPWPAHALVATV